MKIAIINSKGRFLSYFLKDYTKAGIDWDFAGDLEDFQKEYGFKNYSGVLMHPPLGAHQLWLKTVQQSFTNDRIAFATYDLGTTLQKQEVTEGIPLLDFKDVEEIKEYFRIR